MTNRIFGVYLRDKFTTVRFNEDGTLTVTLKRFNAATYDAHAEHVSPEAAERLMIEHDFPLLVKAPVAPTVTPETEPI